jgi:hypothetical protein
MQYVYNYYYYYYNRYRSSATFGRPLRPLVRHAKTLPRMHGIRRACLEFDSGRDGGVTSGLRTFRGEHFPRFRSRKGAGIFIHPVRRTFWIRAPRPVRLFSFRTACSLHAVYSSGRPIPTDRIPAKPCGRARVQSMFNVHRRSHCPFRRM